MHCGFKQSEPFDNLSELQMRWSCGGRAVQSHWDCPTERALVTRHHQRHPQDLSSRLACALKVESEIYYLRDEILQDT